MGQSNRGTEESTQMERIIDYLAEEESRKASKVKMTEQQKLEYKSYRKACQASSVEPVLADFLAGDIPNCVIHQLELQQNEMEWSRRTMAAACGA
jgi:hypothetical protein